MTKTEKKIQNYISGQHLLKEGQKVLVALSGGADSVCLLLFLKRLGYDCTAAHCNFHLRGEESNRDERFVADLCSKLDVPLRITSFDTKAYAVSSGKSIELAARDLRYDFFRQVAQREGIDTVCVAHHRDDNAETFLLNAVRGTGIVGVCGIRAERMDGNLKIVRPLLCLSRADVLQYLRGSGQGYVTDSTNLVDDVARNKVRLDVVPVLRQINPAAVDNIATTIENMKEVYRVYAAAIAADIERCEIQPGILSIDALSASVSPLSVLHEWLQGKGFNRAQMHGILDAANARQSGKIFEAETDCLLVDRNSLILKSAVIPCQPSQITMEIFPVEDVTIERDSAFAYIDADKVRSGLTIRTVLPSDTFQPFGMRGRRLLSDFMTDSKLNLFQKQQQLVVCDGDEIVWVVGLRSSERYRVGNATRRVIILHLWK